MDESDRIILLIGKTKRKSRDIKRILSIPSNFEPKTDKDGLTYYEIQSLRYQQKYYKVSITKNHDIGLCNCAFNVEFREYQQGKRKQARECVHLLALRCYLAIRNSGGN